MAERALVLSVGCVALLACGGGSASPDGSLHGIDGSSACAALTSYTVTFGSDAQTAFQQGSGTTGTDSHYMQYTGKLDADAKYDQLVIELFAGIGTFAGVDIAPKPIPLAGDELQYKSCGACVRVFAGVDDSLATVDQYYMATGGTLQLTQTSGDLQATLSNVAFTHVSIGSDFTSTPVGDCDTAIPALSISAHIDLHTGSGSAALAPTPAPAYATAGILRHRYQ